MKGKVYIILCDSKSVFDNFVHTVASKISGSAKIDYQSIKFNAINNINPNFILYPTNTDHVRFVNKITNDINKFNNSIFEKFVQAILNRDYHRMHIFVRVNTLLEMNKLSRRLKRPNYKTVYITDTVKLTKKEIQTRYKHKFDSKIQYVDDNMILSQAKLFISRHVPSLNFIRN